MSSDIALRVEGLGKKYTIRHKDHDHVTLAQAALHRIRHPRGATNSEEFWALDDVSFEVPRGEVLGVIGHNGAGKSTLLKILSRITPPTKGRVEVFGRIGSLLEVGTGFHPELTGRENVYLNGSILGMKKKEIDRQFDAIVDFSGVEQFLDTPVKRYSSGMYVRLAFAVAAHLDTEILLLDEVLAVGDAEFRKKSLARIQSAMGDGRAVLLVSHDLDVVKKIATSVLVLEQGTQRDYGNGRRTVEKYQQSLDSTQVARAVFLAPRAIARITEVKIVEGGIRNLADNLRISVGVAAKREGSVRISLTVKDSEGVAVGASFCRRHTKMVAGSNITIDLELPSPRLAPGTYHLAVAVGRGDERTGYEDFHILDGVGHFVVEPSTSSWHSRDWHSAWGSIVFDPLEIRGVHSSDVHFAGGGPNGVAVNRSHDGEERSAL